MPSKTAQRPHAISCIKDSFAAILIEHCQDDLTISCDRDDCWEDSELFKWRKAVNIVTRGDFIGSPVKNPRRGAKLGETRSEADSQCWYDATLNIDVQIYVDDCYCDGDDCEDCMDSKSKAYAILAHITSVLFSYQSQILGRNVRPRGSNSSQNSENDIDLHVVTGSFEIQYLFDPARPWVVGETGA